MTSYHEMSIDQLTEYRDSLGPFADERQHTDVILQQRLAVKHAFLGLQDEINGEGLILAGPKPVGYVIYDGANLCVALEPDAQLFNCRMDYPEHLYVSTFTTAGP